MIAHAVTIQQEEQDFFFFFFLKELHNISEKRVKVQSYKRKVNFGIYVMCNIGMDS